MTLTIRRTIAVSKLDAIEVTAGEGATHRFGQANDICVWSSTGAYTITATSQHQTADGFHLRSASGALAPYEVEWAQHGRAHGGAKLSPGRPLTGQHTNAEAADCSRGPDATAGLFMRVPVARLAASEQGYSDAITLIVAPL